MLSVNIIDGLLFSINLIANQFLTATALPKQKEGFADGFSFLFGNVEKTPNTESSVLCFRRGN